MTSLFLYFTILSPTEPKSCSTLFQDIEKNVRNTVQKQNDLSKSTLSNANKLRTLKHLWTVDRNCMIQQSLNISFTLCSPKSENDVCTDKKLLLENWIARSGTPTFASVPISQDPIEIEANNTFDDIEFHTVLNSSDTSYEKINKINDSFSSSTIFDMEKNCETKKKKSLTNEVQEEKLNNDINNKQKRRGICSEADIENSSINENFNQEKLTDEKLNSEKQKRRAICLPNEIDLEQGNEKIKNDNTSLTESQKRRGICSSDQLLLGKNNKLIQ